MIDFGALFERWVVGSGLLIVSGLFGFAFLEIIRFFFDFLNLDFEFVFGIFFIFIVFSVIAWSIGDIIFSKSILKVKKRG